jgi:Mlc titration factor MtfA (ptsG expression regulator)
LDAGLEFFPIFIADMNILLVFLLLATVLGLPVIIYYVKKKRLAAVEPLSAYYRLLLKEKVPFYNHLDHARLPEFEERVQRFLAGVKITGIRTTVEDIDKVLIAASAIIPIFGFPGWEYSNLNEVLLYPNAFDPDFKQKGNDRNILGMVGTGAYEDVMILSKQQLRDGFENTSGKDHTAIHEFVHLIDKTDGAVDGIPESFLPKQYILPWLNRIHETIKQIMENRSDINPYGTTNQAEFFAVVSEYFFKRPDLLKSKHPELYEMLVTIFKQQPKSHHVDETDPPVA